MKCLQNQKGFSLIEVIIAVSIFSIGLLAVAGMQTTSVMGNADAQFVSTATALGQGQIEQLLSLPYEHADLVAGTHTATDGNYSYSWLVTDNDLFDRTKTIQLDVTYLSRGAAKRTRIIVAKADVI